MATATTVTVERENYLNADYGIKSWLLTTDHKRIALLYLMLITFFFFIGGFFALPPPETWSWPTPTTSCSPCTARS